MINKYGNFIKCFCFLIFLGVLTGSGHGQSIASGNLNEKPSTCEFVRATLDSFLVEAKTAPKDLYLIFVFRLGRGENSTSLNKSRIETIQKHIKMRSQEFANYILAESSRNIGIGSVEIYSKGKLVATIHLEKGKNIGDNCKDEPY